MYSHDVIEAADNNSIPCPSGDGFGYDYWLNELLAWEELSDEALHNLEVLLDEDGG